MWMWIRKSELLVHPGLNNCQFSPLPFWDTSRSQRHICGLPSEIYTAIAAARSSTSEFSPHTLGQPSCSTPCPAPPLPRVPPPPLPAMARSLLSQLRGQMDSFSSCPGLLLLPCLNSDLLSKRRERGSMENSYVSVDLSRTRSWLLLSASQSKRSRRLKSDASVQSQIQ